MVQNPLNSASEVSVTVSAQDQATSVIDDIISSLGNLNRTALGVAGGGIAAVSAKLAVDAVESAQSFEDALIDLEKVAGEGVTAGLEDDIEQMATEIPLTAEELTGLAEDAARFGVESEDSLEQFTRSTAKMSTATQLNADQAGEAFAKLSKLTNTPIEDVENLGSSVNELSNTFGASSSEIVDASTRSAGALSNLGLQQTEIFAVSTALNEMSASSKLAGTQLRRFAQELTSADPEPFAQALGISTQEFEQMRDEEPAQLMRMIAQTMNEGGDSAAILRDELSTTSRQAVNNLSQNLDGLENALKTANQSFDDGTSLQEEFRKETEKTSSQGQILRSTLNNIQRSVGEALLPAVKSSIEVAKDAASSFSELNKETDGMLATFSLGAGIVGGLGTALLTLAGGPITAVVGAIGGLALAWQQDWGGIRDVTKQAAEFIQQTTEQFLEFVTQLWDEHGEELTESVEQLTSFISDVWARFGDDIVRILQNWLDLLVALVEPALNNLLETFDLITDALAGDWEGVWESMVSMVQTSVDGIIGIIEASISLASSYIGAWIDVIRAPFEELWDFLVGNSLVPRLFQDAIPRIIRNAIPSISGAVGFVKDAVVGVFEDMNEAVTGIAGDMMDGVADTIDGATSRVVSAAEEQADRARRVYEEDLQEPVTGNSIIPDMMDGIIADIRTATPQVVSATSSLADKFTNRFKEAAKAVARAVQNTADDTLSATETMTSAFQTFQNDANLAFEEVETTMNGFVKNMNDMAEQIREQQGIFEETFTPPGRNDGGGGGGDDSGGSGDSGGDSGGGSEGGGDGGGDGGADAPRKNSLQTQAREIQRAFEGPTSLQKLSMEEAANQFDGLRLFLNRIGGESRWFPNLGQLPPQAELTDEDIKKHQRKRFSQLTGEFQVPAEWIRLAVDPPFDSPNYTPAGETVIDNVPQLDAGGAIRSGGRAMLHAGERVLPEAQVSDSGEASFDPESVADGFDNSRVADGVDEMNQKLDRIDSAIRDDGTVRVSERDVLHALQRVSDRHGISL